MINRNLCRILVLSLLSASGSIVAYAEPTKIGVSLPLSGEGASYGSDYRKIYLFANNKIAGGRYNLIFEDDRCSGKDAVAVANKLTSVDKVSYILGATCDTAFSAAGAVYEKAGVTVVSTSASTVPGKNLFHTQTAGISWAQPLYQYVIPRHKIVGIIFEETVFASNFADNLTKLDKQHELHFIKESFLSNEDNVRPQLLRLKQSNPDAIIVATQTENSLYRVVKQLREVNWNGPRYSTFFPGAKAFLSQAGELADGIIYSDFPDLMGVLNEEGKDLYREYIEQNGEPASGPGLFVGAIEAFRAMDQAIRSGEPASEYLRKTNFHGVLGSWSFGPDGFWNSYQQVIKRIDAGNAVTIQ